MGPVCHKTKTMKTPCAQCKMSLTSHRCCARLKILEQAQTFSASHIITLSGLCIHRKAINKDKHLSCGFLFYHGLNGLNGLNGWDLFPFPRLTPMQPGSDVHPCKQACLPEPPHLSGLPCWQTERNQVTDISYWWDMSHQSNRHTGWCSYRT